jgi:hypothetical protein
MPKTRLVHYSLSNTLLLFAVVAFALAFWRATQQQVPLQARISQLERENLALRNMFGLLTILDCSQVHIIETSHRYMDRRTHPQNQERVWRVWIPEDCAFELHLATGHFSSGVFPDSSPKGPVILGPGEHFVRVTAMASPQSEERNWHLQLAAEKEKRALNAKWLRWEKPLVNSVGAMPHRTQAFDVGNPILIWNLKVEELSTHTQDGLILWLQPSDSRP